MAHAISACQPDSYFAMTAMGGKRTFVKINTTPLTGAIGLHRHLLFAGELAQLRAEISLCMSASGGGSRKCLVNDR